MADMMIHSILFAGIRMASKFKHTNNKVNSDSLGKTRGTIEKESGERQSDRQLPDFVSREMYEQITEQFKRIKCRDMIASMIEIILFPTENTNTKSIRHLNCFNPRHFILL
jgi:hypothetical protein